MSWCNTSALLCFLRSRCLPPETVLSHSRPHLPPHADSDPPDQPCDSAGPTCAHTLDAPQHIYIYSPSGAVRDKAAFRRGIKRLQALGHEVQVDEAALRCHQRFAGDDATRLSAIHRAAASGADLALITRGGYGLSRILGAIDYPALARAVDQGMRFVGLSDFTALQLALWTHTGASTWAGPTLLGDLGCEGEPDDIMLDCLQDLCNGQGEGVGWRRPIDKPRTDHGSPPPVSDIYIEAAPLWGGNLTMLCSLVGTPYLPAAQTKGGILFLEDIGEHPYRIERMLTHLLHAGILGRQQAVVLGQFTDYQLTAHDKGFKLHSVVDWLRTQIPQVPVLTGLPFGHVPTKVLLPVGVRVSLSVEGREALIYWGHTH